MLTCYVNRPDRETKWGKCEALMKASRKKIAVLLDFVQMREGGGPLPKFFVHFSQTVNLGMGREIFWHILSFPQLEELISPICRPKSRINEEKK